MSYIDSPPVRRLSSSSKGQEDLINAYEAEEERIINVLSRKLEQLREEKIVLENTLEAESESHVNKLSRELTALRLAQLQNGITANGGVSASPERFLSSADPSMETMLEAMRRENEQLRNRLADTERDFIRIFRLNEIYREELIEHRNRLGLSVDNLIGMSSPDPFSLPTHYRSSSSSSNASSPSTSVSRPPPHGVPIPRPPSQIRRAPNQASEGNTPLSHSPSSSDSPFPLSPVTSTNPASSVSYNTNLTSPPSFNPTMTFATPSRGLSYPSVPPPSLSSSFGSPTVALHMPHREPAVSPTEPSSRRNSNARRGSFNERRVVETGSLRSSRRESVERGARIAESGSLANGRSRAGSHSQVLPVTTETVNGFYVEEELEEEP
ncbi:hypothetical protein C8J56DRAFT_914086 [Mycena floridula]|nr:hypothetical protein C8J56DRAFT_914086 [Mycena floridula]